ncbi:hypothetical protein MED222_05945 [Vibrio sp. MED222]|nr:hypothetical protein MED222_05945 [Vibrio sp. MED222]
MLSKYQTRFPLLPTHRPYFVPFPSLQLLTNKHCRICGLYWHTGNNTTLNCVS